MTLRPGSGRRSFLRAIFNDSDGEGPRIESVCLSAPRIHSVGPFSGEGDWKALLPNNFDAETISAGFTVTAW